MDIESDITLVDAAPLPRTGADTDTDTDGRTEKIHGAVPIVQYRTTG